MKIYRLWYEWLKRTDVGDWTDRMRAALISCEEPFEKWWAERRRYFEPGFDVEPLWVLTTDKDWHDHKDPDELIVHVNHYCSLQQITEALQELLRKKLERRPGRPKHTSNGDVFRLARRVDAPTVKMLEVMLLIYDMKRSTSLKWWQIGEAINLLPTKTGKALEEGQDVSDMESNITLPDDTHDTAVAKKASMTKFVHRYHDWAELVLENVVKEVFPPDFPK